MFGGQDNQYVYSEIGGFPDNEVADVIVEGVIITEAGPITTAW